MKRKKEQNDWAEKRSTKKGGVVRGEKVKSVLERRKVVEQ